VCPVDSGLSTCATRLSAAPDSPATEMALSASARAFRRSTGLVPFILVITMVTCNYPLTS
jgi:hypothetical protein